MSEIEKLQKQIDELKKTEEVFCSLMKELPDLEKINNSFRSKSVNESCDQVKMYYGMYSLYAKPYKMVNNFTVYSCPDSFHIGSETNLTLPLINDYWENSMLRVGINLIVIEKVGGYLARLFHNYEEGLREELEDYRQVYLKYL